MKLGDSIPFLCSIIYVKYKSLKLLSLSHLMLKNRAREIKFISRTPKRRSERVLEPRPAADNGTETSQIVLANLIDKPPLITDKYWFWGNLIKTAHITVITRRWLISKYTIKEAKIIFKGIRLPVWRRAIWKIALAPPLVFCEFFN